MLRVPPIMHEYLWDRFEGPNLGEHSNYKPVTTLL